eukprot:TRINITY_DN5522_c0_g1_i5.p1 TRINITY_DN5522_c0_g1~~TRINITY_DN5522_c0_g1_i5.p1  ORF type:complete len:279 (-),score=8.64 TRINITY_DN5522_c0_g1_i5:144-980(-)
MGLDTTRISPLAFIAISCRISRRLDLTLELRKITETKSEKISSRYLENCWRFVSNHCILSQKKIIHCHISQDGFTGNQTQVEACWLGTLPDLNQSIPFVRRTLLNLIRNFVNAYKIDGIRIDTVPYVPKDFWAEFTSAASTFELVRYYQGGYQQVMDSVLNYMLYYPNCDRSLRRQLYQQEYPLYAGVCYCYTLGNLLVGITNYPIGGFGIKIDKHPFKAGDTVCNILAPTDTPECITVNKDLGLEFTFTKGFPKIFVVQSQILKILQEKIRSSHILS